MRQEIGFEWVDHFARFPVGIAGRTYRFLIDSGAGLTTVSPTLARSLGAVATGESFSGRRMSGQEVSAPLAVVPDLHLGELRIPAPHVGVIDVSLPDGPDFFDGILGFDVFLDHVLTVDPVARTIVVSDAAVEPPVDAVVVPVEVRREGRSICFFAPLELPSGRVVTMEVDTGSHALILDDRFMDDCGVTPEHPDVDTRTGVDETGYAWTRRLVAIDGSVRIAGEASTAQTRPRTLFQAIIHDGLIGTEFLNRYRYSFDVAGARLVLSPL